MDDLTINVNLNHITDLFGRRPGETFTEYVARTHLTAMGRFTEESVDYVMRELYQPPDQRNRIRHLMSNLVGKIRHE